MSRDPAFAEPLAAKRAYRTGLAELLTLALRTIRHPHPVQADVLRRAETALEPFR